MEVFKRHQQQVDSNLAEETPQFNMISGSDLDDKCNQWLIAPLICKLDSNVCFVIISAPQSILYVLIKKIILTSQDCHTLKLIFLLQGVTTLLSLVAPTVKL